MNKAQNKRNEQHDASTATGTSEQPQLRRRSGVYTCVDCNENVTVGTFRGKIHSVFIVLSVYFVGKLCTLIIMECLGA